MFERRSNKVIEDDAISWVMELEHGAGRAPRDARRETGSACDLISPPRAIEIKAFGTVARGNDLWLEARQVEEARRNPNFFLYVVENVNQGDPTQFTLRVLHGARLARLLERATPQQYYTVPWPVADYDSTQSLTSAEQLRDLPPPQGSVSGSVSGAGSDLGGSATGTLGELVEICRQHTLDGHHQAVIPEPYVPFLPDRGHQGTWNRILVLGEAQNLSSRYDHYVQRLLNASQRERILRLYWEPQIHVKPWDDGTLKLAMSAAFDFEPERFAVSNAVMWSTKKLEGNNDTPGAALQERSGAIWKLMLPLLEPTHIVTTGRVAGDLVARVKLELGARWRHVRLPSASPRYLARQAAHVDVEEVLRRFPTVAEVAGRHPEYVVNYRRNRIYFASEAVRAVTE